MTITRRHLLQGAAFAAAAPSLGTATLLPAHAQTTTEEPAWRHALSLFGEVKYPAGFKRFDYVNPDAPKGGLVRMISIGTFDNFNIAVAGVKGSIAPAAGMIYETLMARSQDEVGTEYGLLAESAAHPDDFSWVIYRLRKEARWHDGKPVTAGGRDLLDRGPEEVQSDVRLVLPARREEPKKPASATSSSPSTAPGNRELPTIVGELLVLPKHYWEGTDSQGRKRDISATTLEPPLGSGPYRIKEFVAGRSVRLERVKDYWGAKLAGAGRPEQFRRNALRVLPRQSGRAGSVQGRSGRLDRGEFGQAMGDGL